MSLEHRSEPRDRTASTDAARNQAALRFSLGLSEHTIISKETALLLTGADPKVVFRRSMRDRVVSGWNHAKETVKKIISPRRKRA